MGNYKFRFSDMIPNAWFYKLKDMSKTRKHHHLKKKQTTKATSTASQKTHISQPRRYSYYLTTAPIKADKYYNSPTQSKPSSVTDPSRKSSKKITKRKTIYKPSQSSPDFYFSSTESSSPEFYKPPPHLSDSEEEEDNNFVSSSTRDIVIDINSNALFTHKVKKTNGFDPISEIELPPILTKPAKLITEKTEQVHSRKSSSNSRGIKLRANSPRIASKRIQSCARKSVSSKSWNRSLSESFAVVKSSIDPEKDFRDSMVEMIVENNITSSKDLEDLLACYLSLNSNEFHDLIVMAFEQIWFDMPYLCL